MRRKVFNFLLAFFSSFYCYAALAQEGEIDISTPKNFRHQLKKDLLESDEQRRLQIQKRLGIPDFEEFLKENLALDQKALQEISQQTPQSMPFDFHYIWVGGPLYQEYWHSMCGFAALLKKAQYPGKVHIWVDKHSNIDWLLEQDGQGGRKRVPNEYFSCYEKWINIINTDELLPNNPDFLTSAQWKEFWNLVNWELHGLKNLAAVSDYLRLEILRQRGGIYLDCDLLPLTFNAQDLSKGLVFPHNFKTLGDNNCVIGSTSNHPILKTAIRYGVINYLKSFSKIQEKRKTDHPLHHLTKNFMNGPKAKSNPRFDGTILTSGPALFYYPILQCVDIQTRQDLSFSQKSSTSHPFLKTLDSTFQGIQVLLDTEFFLENKKLEKIKIFLKKKNEGEMPLDTNLFYYNFLSVMGVALQSKPVDKQGVLFFAEFLQMVLSEINQQTPFLKPQQNPEEYFQQKLTSLKEEILNIKKGDSYLKRETHIRLINEAIAFVQYHLEGVLLNSYNPQTKRKVFEKNPVSFIDLGSGLRFLYLCENTWMGQPYRYPSFDNEFRSYGPQDKIMIQNQANKQILEDLALIRRIRDCLTSGTKATMVTNLNLNLQIGEILMLKKCKTTVENTWATLTKLAPGTPWNPDKEVEEAVKVVLKKMGVWKIRVSQRNQEQWVTYPWIKLAILLSFRIFPNQIMEWGGMSAYDKIPLKFEGWKESDFQKAGFRVCPGAVVRESAYIGPGVILMPNSFVNMGAYIGERTMVDTGARIGSCAQIGALCHISGGVGIGGVLEPLQNKPVIIEDFCFIGANSEIAEGVIIEKGSVISMGSFIGASTKIVDRQTGEIFYGRVPAYSVVVPGFLPNSDPTKPGLACAVIIKHVDEQTRKKTSINELLRE